MKICIEFLVHSFHYIIDLGEAFRQNYSYIGDQTGACYIYFIYRYFIQTKIFLGKVFNHFFSKGCNLTMTQTLIKNSTRKYMYLVKYLKARTSIDCKFN